jgi:hypothetical protein
LEQIGLAHASRKAAGRRKSAHQPSQWFNLLAIDLRPHHLQRSPNNLIAMMHETTQNTYADGKDQEGTLYACLFPGCFFSLPTYPQLFLSICTIQKTLSLLRIRRPLSLVSGSESQIINLLAPFGCGRDKGV